jgi:hypothetical protein
MDGRRGGLPGGGDRMGMPAAAGDQGAEQDEIEGSKSVEAS